MNKKMEDHEIDKIARAIAAKIAEPGGGRLLGCGSASFTSDYTTCSIYAYNCYTYECGGAGNFTCGYYQGYAFTCYTVFRCYTDFTCNNFTCGGFYNP